MIYTYELHGVTLQTGDLICTTNGETGIIAGEFWRLIGCLVPGDVDHIAIYVGPGGRCVESAALGVVTFEIPGSTWDSIAMQGQRQLIDHFYGIAYPLQGRNLPPTQEIAVREAVAHYCLAQATARKRYNLNFLDSQTEDAFYCSQLAYKAYQLQGIDLNSGQGVPALEGTQSIIFPQEIWSGCTHFRPASSG